MYTLLAIVCIFILCNLLPAFLVTADMIHFRTITACRNFDDPDNRDMGYSTINTILTIIGMEFPEWNLKIWIIDDKLSSSSGQVKVRKVLKVNLMT